MTAQSNSAHSSPPVVGEFPPSPTDVVPQSRLSLVVITSGLKLGGAELMLLRLLKTLNQGVFSPSIVSLTAGGPLEREFVAAGIPVLALDFGRGLGGLWRGVPHLIRYLRESEPAVVQTWMYHADVIGGIVSRLVCRAPCVWGVRNSTVDRQHTRLLTRVVVRAAAILSHIIPRQIVSCSERAIDIHATLGYDRSKMLHIPNGFDGHEFQRCSDGGAAVRAEFSIPPEAPVVGMLGRYSPQKNFSGFIDVATRTLAARPDVFFLLAGDGVSADNSELREMIERAHIDHAVRLAGPRRDVPRLMSALDALIMPSLFGEAFPNVVAEAMLCGVPCVGFDVGDISNIIGVHGFTVELGDTAEMATRLGEVLDRGRKDPRFDPAHIRRSVEGRFTMPVVSTAYERVYEQCLAASQQSLFLKMSMLNGSVMHVRFVPRPLSWVGRERGFFFKVPYRTSSLFADATSVEARDGALQEFRCLKALRTSSCSVVEPLEVIEERGCLVVQAYEARDLREVILKEPAGKLARTSLEKAFALLGCMHSEISPATVATHGLLVSSSNGQSNSTIVIDGFEVRNLMVSASRELLFFDPHRLSWGDREEDVTRFILSLLMLGWSRRRPRGVFREFSMTPLLRAYEEAAGCRLDRVKLGEYFHKNIDMRQRHAGASIARMSPFLRRVVRGYRDWYFGEIQDWGKKHGF